MLSLKFSEVVLSYVGTPFVERGREPGIGLDCIGVLSCALETLGIPTQDRLDYAIADHSNKFERICEFICPPFSPIDWPSLPGDVLIYRRPGRAGVDGHAVVYTGDICGAPWSVEAILGATVQHRPVYTDWADRIERRGGSWRAFRLLGDLC